MTPTLKRAPTLSLVPVSHPTVTGRLAVCGVWEILFADATPGCLGGGEPITHHHTIPSYMPQYAIDARTAEKARKKEQEERQKQVGCWSGLGFWGWGWVRF